jgi:hypothetical protein
MTSFEPMLSLTSRPAGMTSWVAVMMSIAPSASVS